VSPLLPRWGGRGDELGQADRFGAGRGGADHFIACEPGGHCVSPEEFRSLHAADEARLDARGAVFLCRAYRFAGDIGAGFVQALPRVLAIVDDLFMPLVAVNRLS
jgi:hypothetical protein